MTTNPTRPISHRPPEWPITRPVNEVTFELPFASEDGASDALASAIAVNANVV